MEGPDIPPWLYAKHTNENSLYLFGAAPRNLNLEFLEVSSLTIFLNFFSVLYYPGLIKIWKKTLIHDMYYYTQKEKPFAYVLMIKEIGN